MNATAPPAEELRQLRKDYLGDLEEQVALIRQHGEALLSRRKFKISYPVLLYTAHQLKGSGGTIGFAEISALGKKLSESLDSFLSDTEKRPSPGELSKAVLAIAGELEAATERARATVGT
ncbi:MAG TPA: Hpt domain-containing protein [Thermoanaerobaculia bacterium]|nr:Hpt domain-containing protein [Thermoanaerobaculia bacterium]